MDRVTMTTDFLGTEPTPHTRSSVFFFFFFLLVSERHGGVFASGGDITLTLGRRQKKVLSGLTPAKETIARDPGSFAFVEASPPPPCQQPCRAHHPGRPRWARLAPSPVLVSAPLVRPVRARAHTRRGCVSVNLRVRAGARGRAGARAGPGASMMEERAAAAVASAAACRPLGSGTAPNPTAAAPASSPAPGPGPVGKGGGGGGSPGPTAGPEPLSLPGILHFIQHEWARFEAEKARWEAERAELQVSAAAALPRPPPQPCPARPVLASPAAAAAILEQWPPGRPGGGGQGRRRAGGGVPGASGRAEDRFGSEELSRAESVGSRKWE